MEEFTYSIYEARGQRPLIVYGAGAVGEVVYHGLKLWGITPDFFCDHDPELKEFKRITVIPPLEMTRYKEPIVIVAFKDFARKAVRILKKFGINKYYSARKLINENFEGIDLSQRAKEFLVRKKCYENIIEHVEQDKYAYCNHIEFMITERCTLNCTDCSACIPLFKKPRNLKINDSFSAFDRLLESIDFLEELSVLGGEPLLHPQLGDLLSRYHENKKIGMIALYTNGTILPTEQLLDRLESPNIWVHISNYGKLSNQVSTLCEIFERRGINYFVRKYDEWQSAGTFYDRKKTSTQLEVQYSKCFKARCYSFYDSCLYTCSRASNAWAAGKIPRPEYVDFSTERTLSAQKNELENLMQLQFSKACQYCDGFILGKANVVPAIQRGKNYECT